MTSDTPVGIYRTYVYIPPDEPFTYENWCRNMTAGRTFHSGGPILKFSVDGHRVGDTVTLPGNGGTVEVTVEAESILPIHSLEIVQEGRVVASSNESAGARRLSLNAKVKVEGHSWLAARCGGPGYAESVPHLDGWGRGVDGPHVARLYRVRRRMVDVQSRGCGVYAYPGGWVHLLRSTHEPPASIRRSHTPPRRGRPPGLP